MPEQKKSAEKQADEKALRDLKAAHPAEYDGYRKQHADQMKQNNG